MNYSNTQVRSYLHAHYVPTYRIASEDHFYNFRNRKTIPISISKPSFSETDLKTIFNGVSELEINKELNRFKTYVSNLQNLPS